MWGNKLGWGISTVILAFSAYVMYVIGMANRLAVTAGFAEGLKPIELPVSPNTVVTMDQACDATTAYRNAIADYDRAPSDYIQDFRTPQVATTPLKGIDDVVAGTHCANMALYAGNPSEAINYKGNHPELDDLDAIGELMLARGLYQENQLHNSAEANKLYEAAFALGAHLFKERLIYREAEVGMALMSGAAQSIKLTAHKNHDAAREKICDDFYAAYLDYDKKKILPIWDMLSTGDQTIATQRVGDTITLAESPTADRLWRVEAIRTLGRYKFIDVGAGGQRRAGATVRKLANDSDPAIHAAATLAGNLTLDDYRNHMGESN